MPVLHRLISTAEWGEAKRIKAIFPSDLDVKSGFVHLSTPSQSSETVKRYFSPEVMPLILEIDVEQLGDALKWEYVPSRGQDMPHLYRDLRFSDVLGVRSVEFVNDGVSFGSLMLVDDA